MIPAKMSWFSAPSVTTPEGRRLASPATVPYFLDGWHRNPNDAFASWRLWNHYNYILSGGGEEVIADSYPHDGKTAVVFLDGHVELNAVGEGAWEGAGEANDWNKAMFWDRSTGPLAGRAGTTIMAF